MRNFICVLLFSMGVLSSCQRNIPCDCQKTLQKCFEEGNILLPPPSIELNLPTSKPPVDRTTSDSTVIVVVNLNNKYEVDGNLITSDQLEELILKLKKDSGIIIQLDSHSLSNWKTNVAVIDLAKKYHLKLVIKTKH